MTIGTYQRPITGVALIILFEKNLPDIDIFICTADPVKEPAVSVVNTVLSAMAFDYPVEKLACYLSDDGGSPLTFYALLEASSFAKSWLPFCNKYFIEQRCPEKFFLENIRNAHNVPISEFKKLKKLYEEMKDRINRTVEMGAVPDVIQKKHNGFKEWTSTIFTSRNHPSVVQIVLENGKDLDDEGGNLPSLIYVSREKRPGHPHHYKAGALNVLIRISAVMSNAPFILTLDCDMYANNTQALRQAMCFFLDPISGHQFAYVQFPQTFHGITKNDLYANDLKRIYQVHNKGMDGVGGPIYAGTGCIHRRDVLCGRDSSELIRMNIEATEKTSPPNMLKVVSFANCTWEENTEWGKKIGMIYGCAVEDVLTGFTIHSRGWKSAYCNPKRKAFLGCAPVNLNDTLTQHKRWSAGLLELFVSKFCPYVHGIQHTRIAHRMGYSRYSFWALLPFPTFCYALLPGLCLINGLSLFPKVSDTWFPLFAFLLIGAYSHSMIELMWVGASFKKVGFEVTSKVVDMEAIQRYEAEIFEFGVASALFVPPTTLAVINLITLLGGIVHIMREGYSFLDNMFVQLFLSSFVVAHGYAIFEAMLLRKDNGRMPNSITVTSITIAVLLCSFTLTHLVFSI
eukprot:Gb_25252 [translate_table: standard]